MLINKPLLDLAFRGFKSIYTQANLEAPSEFEKIAMTVPSGSRDKSYGWIGNLPAMREWIGSRVIGNLSAYGFTITNRKFELTVSVDRTDIEDDRLELATCDRALPPAGEAPEWVHLLPPGKMQGRDGRAYELADPPGLILAFQSGGIDLPVDFEHQNDKPDARLHGPVPAAGWIKELRADASGLWGRVEWTATAREMIGRKEYRFLSPSFLHNKAGQIMRLKGAGLVHNPNLYLTALASQESPMKPIPPDTAKPASLAEFAAALAALIGLPPETPPKDLLAALKAKIEGEPDPAKYMPVAAVQSMLAGRMEERLALSEERAEEKVNRAFKGGFLVTAMKPWALALCRSDEAAFDDYLAKSGPVFAHLMKPSHANGTPPRALASEAAASDLERAVCEQLGLKPGSLIE